MKVPTYQGNQVRSKNTVDMGASVNTPIEGFGGGAANVVKVATKAADTYNDIYKEYKKKADEIKITEAQYKLAEMTNKMMNPIDGALSKKGKDSFGLLEKFPEDYSKAISEIEKELSEDQKSLFSEHVLKEKLKTERQLQDHVAGESVRYDNEVTSNLTKTLQNRMANEYKDLNAVDMYAEQISMNLEKKAIRNGKSKADIQAEIDKEVSNGYANAIYQMIANDKEDVALEYYNFKKADIKDASVREQLEKAVDEGANRKNAQKIVDGFVSGGMSETAAYNKARGIENSKLRKEVEDRIKLDYGRRDAARKDFLEKTTIRMYNMVEKGGDPRKDPVWQSLEPSQRNTILAYMKRATDGDEAVTDPVLYKELKDMVADPEKRNEFMKMNLWEHYNDLNKKQFDEILSVQKELRSGKSDLANDVGSKSEVFKNTIESIGGYDDKEKAALKLKIDVIESNLEKAKGRKLTPVEYLQELDNLLKNEISNKSSSETLNALVARIPVAGPALSTITNRFRFGTSKKIIDLSSEDIENISYESIPKQDVKVIEKVLMQGGRRFPSPEEVTELYKERLREIHGVED